MIDTDITLLLDYVKTDLARLPPGPLPPLLFVPASPQTLDKVVGV
jgi:hypothetical protein